MGFLIFVTEQSVYIHQYCWREGVNTRLLTKFKGDTPKGWQRYCTTKPQNFIDVCMVGSTLLPLKSLSDLNSRLFFQQR